MIYINFIYLDLSEWKSDLIWNIIFAKSRALAKTLFRVMHFISFNAQLLQWYVHKIFAFYKFSRNNLFFVMDFFEVIFPLREIEGGENTWPIPKIMMKLPEIEPGTSCTALHLMRTFDTTERTWRLPKFHGYKGMLGDPVLCMMNVVTIP